MSSFRSSLSLTVLSLKFPLRDVSIFQNEMPDSKLNGCTLIPIAAGAHGNSHEWRNLLSTDSPNHIGRLKKKFNYKFNSPTVTANCTWRRSSDFHRSIIPSRVDCNFDDRSFIVSRSS